MSQTVRIDRDAFRKGVEDVMTFAPLRDAVRTASGVFGMNKEKPADSKTGLHVDQREGRSDDGKSTSR